MSLWATFCLDIKKFSAVPWRCIPTASSCEVGCDVFFKSFNTRHLYRLPDPDRDYGHLKICTILAEYENLMIYSGSQSACNHIPEERYINVRPRKLELFKGIACKLVSVGTEFQTFDILSDEWCLYPFTWRLSLDYSKNIGAE